MDGRVAYHRPTFEGSAGRVALGLGAEDIARQRDEPVALPWAGMDGEGFIFRDLIVQVHRDALGDSSVADIALMIKHAVLSKERAFQRMRREVEAFENVESLRLQPRDSIPTDVRLYVWQRDKGRCANCESKQRIEYDHVIPVVEGGSSTARNIQLLCEACNRAKGGRI